MSEQRTPFPSEPAHPDHPEHERVYGDRENTTEPIAAADQIDPNDESVIEADTTEGGVPAFYVEDHSIPEIEEWVGDDKERAQQVLDNEQKREDGTARKTLVAAMEAVLDKDGE